MKKIVCLSVLLLLSNCTVINRPLCGHKNPAEAFPKCHPEAHPATWPSSDNTPLPYIAKLPKDNVHPKAVVILVPGWDGTLCDYKELTDHLTRHGYAVYGSELRGQTYDPKWSRRGNIKNWHPWVQDLKAFTKWVRKNHPDMPVFYHGQSMGCVISLATIADSTKFEWPAGVILQSPAIGMMPEKESGIQNFIATLIGWIRPLHILLMDKLKMELTGDNNWDYAWMKSDDRLHRGYSLRFMKETLGMGHKARLTSHNVPVPVLALAGGKDRIAKGIGPGGSLYCYMCSGLHAADVKKIYYPEGRHLLVAGNVKQDGELLKHRVLQDITNWLDSH